MKNFQKILDRIVQKRFKGDKDKIAKYYDFISLYLSRYENAYVSLCDDHGICLKNRDDDFTNTIVLVEKDNIYIETEIYTRWDGPFHEVLQVFDYGFNGTLLKPVLDESGILYSGIKSVNGGKPIDALDEVLKINFNNKCIYKDDKEPIYRFSSSNFEVIFSELLDYSEKQYKIKHDSFFVGKPEEKFDVLSINYKFLSEEEIDKYEDEIKSLEYMPNDLYECYHQDVLKDVNPEDVYLSHGEVTIDNDSKRKK